MDQNKINALIHLRECIDAMREGRDGDGQFSQKAYELIDELLAARAASTGETAPTNAQRLAVARQYGIEAEDSPEHGGIMYNASDEDIERLVDALAARVPAPSAPQEPADEECRYCDGCGWTEGGMTLMTDCPKCNGTGRVERK